MLPKLARDLNRFDASPAPPRLLIADTMNRPVMDAAKGYDKSIADLTSECTRLREAQVVRITMLAPTHETRLLRDKPEMLFIAITTWFGDH